MKKRTTAAFLLFFTVLQVFGEGLVIVQFYTQRNYVAQNLCINRNKPQLKCGGLCQLRKKLKEDSKKEQSNPGRHDDGKLEFSSFLLNNHEDNYTPGQLENEFLVFTACLPARPSSSFFHPPAALS